MRSHLVSIGAILLSTAFLLLGNGLIGTLTPLRAQIDGFSGITIGGMASLSNAGFVVGCLVSPQLLARVGHVRTFAVGAALTAATVLLQALSAAPIGGFQLFSLAAIVYMCCVVPVGLTRLPQPLPPTVPVLRIRRLLREAPVGMAGVVTVGFANGAVWTLAPVYANSLGYDTAGVALFMSAFILGGALVQWPLSRYSDAFDRRWLAAGVCGAAAIVGVVLALLGRASASAPTLLYPVAFIFGATMLPLYSLSVAHANDRMDRSEFVEASATLLLANGLASTAGPALAAFVMVRAGAPALFVYTAAIDGIMAAFALWRIVVLEAVPTERREQFVPVPQQASIEAVELDPRGRDDVDVEAA